MSGLHEAEADGRKEGGGWEKVGQSKDGGRTGWVLWKWPTRLTRKNWWQIWNEKWVYSLTSCRVYDHGRVAAAELSWLQLVRFWSDSNTPGYPPPFLCLSLCLSLKCVVMCWPAHVKSNTFPQRCVKMPCILFHLLPITYIYIPVCNCLNPTYLPTVNVPYEIKVRGTADDHMYSNRRLVEFKRNVRPPVK